MGKICLDPQSYSFGNKTIYFPCGRCPNCRDLSRMQFAARFLIEKAVHPEYDTFFLALTYDERYYPSRFRKDHIDAFLQSLRNRTKDRTRLRYVLVSEYGDLDRRRHFHFLVHTTVKYPDRGFSRLESGHLTRSNEFVATVRDCWPFGFVDDGGTPTAAAVMYTMGYALKEDAFSIEHEDDLRHLRWCSQHHIKPPLELRCLKGQIPFRRFSLRPGIGLDDESLAWVYRYMYNDGVNYRFSINLGDGFNVPVPGIYLDKISLGLDPAFSYFCKAYRKHLFETDYQDSLQDSIDRCSDGSLSASVRLARIKKRQDDRLQKALSQQLNIYRHEI